MGAKEQTHKFQPRAKEKRTNITPADEGSIFADAVGVRICLDMETLS
jgi:hypothetical protein